MRRAAGWLWLAAVLLLSLPALAQGSPGGVLTVDPERLFQDTRYGRRVVSELELEAADLQAENRRIEATLSAEERELTDRRPSLEPEEFRALADAFDARVERVRAEQDGKARDLQRARDQGQQTFFQSIGPILSALVSERGAAVLVDRRAVILSTETVDITDAAIRRIDAELGEGLAAEDGSALAPAAPSGTPDAAAPTPPGNAATPDTAAPAAPSLATPPAD